ncbi:MAG TPA: hypothetical protein VNP72_10970 [Longimicrobium sp.]|nr:hypothetical protein [Longimicrobium sp.]
MSHPRIARCLGFLVLAAACVEGGTAPPGSVLRVETPWTEPVRLAAAGEVLALGCTVRLGNGETLDAGGGATVRTRTGVLRGSTCGSLAVRRSGIDTVDVRWRGLSARAVVAVALPTTVVEGPVGTWLDLDSLGGPPGDPWAPSVRRNSAGKMEVYYTVYRSEGGSGKGTLQRLVSDDGVRFRQDGVVLRPDAEDCAPRGTGIENVVVVPRAEAPGWRMLFAAGSNLCFGWQVFSAVSSDERTWTVEPGVRVDNGGALPPTSSGNPYWGQGEGMVLDRLPDGEWRMTQGGFEPVTPGEFRFQITEWRSADQLAWRYVGPVLTTRDMPPTGRGSVYSPTIRELAPGLFRMLFTGDHRDDPAWRSRMFSAVSLDRRHWQVEGELMGAEGTDIFYAALLDERVVFIRRAAGLPTRLGIATVRMP